VKSLGQHLLPSIFRKTTSVQQQLKSSPNGLVDPFALAVSGRMVSGRRAARNASSGGVSPRLLTDKGGAPVATVTARKTTDSRQSRQTITVLDFIVLQGKTNGKREYSSTAIR